MAPDLPTGVPIGIDHDLSLENEVSEGSFTHEKRVLGGVSPAMQLALVAIDHRTPPDDPPAFKPPGRKQACESAVIPCWWHPVLTNREGSTVSPRAAGSFLRFLGCSVANQKKTDHELMHLFSEVAFHDSMVTRDGTNPM